jgi:PTH1 family peptidyl-tRNA hydrolase
MAGTALQIIAGLGNPGPEHRLTRHNAGFWFVDALARAHGAQFRAHSRYHGEICRVTIEGPRSRAAQAADLYEPQRNRRARAG